MKEIDVIKHAKNYMDMLSKGYNPITKEKYSPNSDINNERLLKCFSFVSEILERVIITETEAEEKEKQNVSDSQSGNATAETKDTTKVNENQDNPEPLYSPSSLVADDVEGIDVVNTLIQKGVLKQGYPFNNSSS